MPPKCVSELGAAPQQSCYLERFSKAIFSIIDKNDTGKANLLRVRQKHNGNRRRYIIFVANLSTSQFLGDLPKGPDRQSLVGHNFESANFWTGLLFSLLLWFDDCVVL